MYKILLLVSFLNSFARGGPYDVDLPDKHIPYYLFNDRGLAEKCLEDESCPWKDHAENEMKCWGYEYKCQNHEVFSKHECPGAHKGWVRSKEEQMKTFYNQGDFGYIKEKANELTVICEPTFLQDSALECTKHLQFCRGRNIMINFTALNERKEPLRYKMDVLKQGEIGGHCKLHTDRLNEESDHISPLQSWGPEMRYFTEIDDIVDSELCDTYIEKPVIIMKIDATVNMYHHFCDFLNLYASQHLNSTNQPKFSTDVHILIWESYRYFSSFGVTFEAFTDHPIWNLDTFKGRSVCFKNIMFPLLPRMIFGLYYNTPIVWGCEKSGLFQAFSEHILHRLRIPKHTPKDKRLRITFLSRDTSHRNILNEDQLIEALKNNTQYNVKKVVYNQRMPFKEQLEITSNSDIFIGIHGAGLTHLLFLPDWAAVFEVYNCEDVNCYFDLARLRGVKYFTWKDNTKMYQQDEVKVNTQTERLTQNLQTTNSMWLSL
ncbi:EGF domain-specific O-linked N-acetylglucosamine transferase isoform X2 [Cimex lectularius]|uniref:EGF domain-specific O-linked N-acetylglucosamine transferase n=1 Tax=Cimex lectularius TaxID=79782 RepID=A0A8I6SB42_CIMLE|nr:EGF domain-specific O-linked N-acetylglucosamine transferase isoform X2 [Cimex lectularius]